MSRRKGMSSSVDLEDDLPRIERRQLPLVDLRGPGVMASSSIDLGGSAPHHRLHLGLSASASVGHGRRTRTPLTDLDSKFVTKSGFCASTDVGEGGSFRGLSGAPKITHFKSAPGAVGGRGSPSEDTLPRFPRLDQCAHFHYEYVELPPIQAKLISEELKPLSQAEDAENKSLLVQVTSMARSWVVRRTYENFRFLDRQLHRCCYDRKYSLLSELPPEENLPGDDKETAVENTIGPYLRRFSDVAGSLITCGPVLGWFELDNRGHRLIVTDDSDINTPAVAAAYVVKRYTAQASDEISFEVGDMISVIDTPPPEESIWWRGKRGFQVGFFPCECVQVIGDKVPQGIHPQTFSVPVAPLSTSPPSHPATSGKATTKPLKPVLRKHGKLIAFFRSDLVDEKFRSFILSRPSRRKLKQSGILRERVFGCDLGEHLSNSGHDIPMVLKCCAEFIESHGTVDGIYRLSGVTSNIQKLRHAFDEERVPDLYGDENILKDIHCVSSVLKMYFRELPNPLLTYQLYDKFVLAVMRSEELRLLHVRDIVQQLPPPHYRTLQYLIQHLAGVASHSSDTGMTPRNIAIVWAPNLLRSKDLEKGGVAALQDVGTQAVVTEYLVRYVDLIFNDKIPLFPRPTNGVEGTPRKSRPKSLAISTPTKLISIDEARNRALSAIKSDQKYMEVGGGPQNLPKTYHTVIDLPSRKGGSLKQKKSPLGWKTLFSKNRHQRKASTPNEMLSNISVSVITESDLGEFPARKLRPVKSVESLVSTPVSAHLSRNQQQEAEVDAKNLVIDRPANERIDEKKEVFGSSPSDSGSSPSRRTHNRSISHDSYFNLFVRSSPSTTSPISSKHRNAMDRGSYSEFSPESPKIPLLDISELNLDFATSEAEMKIFSEDDTLKSTSMDDTLSRSTVDLENVSMNSDYAIRKSEEKDGKRSFKEKLKQKFTSPSLPRKETPINDSSEDSCSDSLRRASASFKDTVVQTLSPEMTRKREGNSQFSDFPPFIDTFKEAAEEEETCGIKDSKSPKEFLRDNSLEEESSRGSIESALIDAELLEKITHLRVSSSETSSLSLAEAPDNDIFSVNVEGCLPLEVYQPENWDVPAVVADTSGEGTGSIKHKSRPDSLLGNGTSMEFFPSLISPDTPQGDFVCFDIQYHPLSDTTEPSSPSESHVEGDITSVVELSQVPKQPSPLSPDLSSSSSVDDPLENCHVYENLELGSYQPLIRDFTHFEDSSAKDSSSSSLKQSPENETPPWEGQVDYENFSYGNVNKADSFGSESATPCYENCIMDFKGAESVEEVSAPSTEAEESLTYTKLNETKYCGDDDYEAMLFNEFSSLESPKKEKSDVELDGELVYQQVKYLRKSIQEVNDILRGGASYCTCGDGELTLPLKSEVTPLIDINTQSEDSECLESPVTPSSSSLVTELLVLPSFSSPTESTTEEGTSPEVLLEPQSSPRISYHLHSPSAPDSAVRSPSLQKGADLATMTLLIPSVGANSCFVPSPLPRKIPPVPKPRSLPTLHTRVPVPDESSPVTPPSNPSVSPDSPATSCTSDSSPGQLLSSDSSQPPATSLSPRSPQSQFPLLYSEERCFYDQTKPNGARSINEVFPTADVESALESSKQACLMDTIFPEPNFGLSEDSTAEKYGLGKSEDILSNNEYPKHNLGSLIESPNNSPILEFPKDATRHKPNQEHKKHIAMQSLILVPPKFYTPTPLQLESTKRCVVEQQTGGAVQPDDSKSEMEWIIQRKQDHGHPGDSNSETEKLEHPRLDVNHPDDHEFKQGMSPPDAPKSESESQKRERIEKYKEERRLFLREKYKSESFKGEKDDMMLRLKQKATSPSRMEESEGQPDSCPEVVLTDPRSSLVVDEFSAIDECTDAKPTVSHDSTIEKESHSSRRNEYLTHSSPGVLTLDEDINVKEKVAIWSRNDEGSKSIDGKPKEKPPSPMKVVSKAPTSNPVKLRKVQVNPITRMNSVPFSSSVAQSPPTSFGGKKINSVSVSKSEVFIPQLYAKNEVKLKVSDTKAKTSSKSENEGRPGRSYSVGSPPGPKVNPQPRIKDMKALFEREPHSEFAKSLPLRQTSKGGV